MAKLSYCKRHEGNVFIVRIEGFKITTPFYMWDLLGGIEIKYNIDCDTITFKSPECKHITKKEFMEIVNKAKETHKVNFTIKTK